MKDKKKTKNEIERLNALLCDAAVLQQKTKAFHWNVTGMHFNTLHTFFETQYQAISVAVDDLAERIRALGAFPPSTMKEFLSGSSLKENSGVGVKAEKMVADLLSDHETVIGALGKAIEAFDESGDVATADLLTGLQEQHQKMAWMLRSHLR